MTTLAAPTISEAQLQAAVEEMATVFHWRKYHAYDSRRSTPGFPDLVLLSREQRRLIFAELKSATGQLSREQRRWIEDLRRTQAEVALWRPADWLDGTIERVLRGEKVSVGSAELGEPQSHAQVECQPSPRGPSVTDTPGP